MSADQLENFRQRMVDDAVRKVDTLHEKIVSRVDDMKEKVAEKCDRSEMQIYVDQQVDSKHKDQTEAVKLMIEKLGNGILTDMEAMGRDMKASLEATQRRFIEEEIVPLVGRLVEGEVERKDRLRKEAAEKARAEQRQKAADERAEKAEKQARLYRWVSIGAVIALIIYRVFWPMLGFAGGGGAEILEEMGSLG